MPCCWVVHRRFGGTYCLHLQNRHYKQITKKKQIVNWVNFLALLILQFWRWRQYLPPIHRRAYTLLHGLIFHKIIFSIYENFKCPKQGFSKGKINYPSVNLISAGCSIAVTCRGLGSAAHASCPAGSLTLLDSVVTPHSVNELMSSADIHKYEPRQNISIVLAHKCGWIC
jgi:hypothetical protein